jgi:tripartite-type tricarboxylate transporter receptor subunit TctC
MRVGVPETMRFRRVWLAGAVALACGLGAMPAGAESYPTRPIKIVVPTPAGGPVDVAGRIVASYLSTTIGQNVIVENRPGAGNTIGSREVAQADPDGYTLLYSSASGLVLAPMLQKNAGYDPIESYEPIILVAASSNVLVVNPSLPVNSVQELVAYAKDHPGKVNFSSGGIGVLPHLIGELFKAKAGITIVHVPYRGGAPSITDVVSGQVQMTFEGTSVLVPFIRAGKLRALAVTSAKRVPELPEVPTMAESGFPEVVSTSWTGLLAPAGTSREIIIKLNLQLNEGLSSQELREMFAKRSSDVIGGSPQDFTNLIKSDTAKWTPIVKTLALNGQH